MSELPAFTLARSPCAIVRRAHALFPCAMCKFLTNPAGRDVNEKPKRLNFPTRKSLSSVIFFFFFFFELGLNEL